MKVNFNCDENLKQYTDSMLFDSGTIVASLDCEHNGYKICIDLKVCGEVDVTYKGEDYRYPSDFPDELKEIIKNEPTWFIHTDDLYVTNNNWFEYIYDCSYNGQTWSNGVLFESNLSAYSEIDLLNEMCELAMEIMEE